MKVLMVVDQEQRRTFPLVDRWARTITGIGVHVVMESDFSDFCFDEIECVHLFDLDNMKSVSSWLDLATARSIPCVITPNYWSPYEFLFETGKSPFTRISKALLPDMTALAIHEGHYRSRTKANWQNRRDILRACKCIVPFSQAEQAQLMDEFDLTDYSRFAVCSDMIDPLLIDLTVPDLFLSQYGQRDLVLCTGPISEHGNQLELLWSLRGAYVPVVIMGEAAENDESYLCQCRKAAQKIKGKVFFITDRQSPQMVYSALKNARVHANPAWWDNQLTTSMEAALAGCHVVITDRSPAREYFGQDASLADPSRRESMRYAVLRAYASTHDPSLPVKIRERFGGVQQTQTLTRIYEVARGKS